MSPLKTFPGKVPSTACVSFQVPTSDCGEHREQRSGYLKPELAGLWSRAHFRIFPPHETTSEFAGFAKSLGEPNLH
jgi:hypothetical protein